MTSNEQQKQQPVREPRDEAPFRVRLPGFVSESEIGLGDVVSRTTSAFGIRPCAGCDRRANTLNRWLVISPWRSR